jgi:hypothetical protein
LQNSTDAKVIEQLEATVKQKQQTINNLVNTLGAEEIKSLSDLENLLRGKTLKELITHFEQRLEKAQQTFTHQEESYLAKQNQLKTELSQAQARIIETNQAF